MRFLAARVGAGLGSVFAGYLNGDYLEIRI